MNRSPWLLVAVLMARVGLLSAQDAPDRDAILSTVNRFFAGMKARDTALMRSAVDSGAAAVAVAYRDGIPTIVATSFQAAAARIAALSSGPEERLLAAEVWQDGDVAMVWAPYRVDRAGAESHCGHDSFTLIRRADRWLIADGAYTARPDGCPAIRDEAAGPLPLPAPDPADRAAVMAAVDSFFTALRDRDTALLGRAASANGAWTTAAYRDGRVTIGRRAAAGDAAILTRATEPLHERLLDAVVRVDGDLAVVWGPYRFAVGDRVSHCGHDGFRLIRREGRWRLDGGIYTVRPDGCARLMSPRQVDSLPSRPPDTVIAYGADPHQIGELRLPPGPGPFPVAVVIHGGCWQRMFASARNTAALADALRDRGIATWNVEYRTADEPGGAWPGTFLDVAAAADYVRTLARRYPLDTTRTIAVGHSAGGHLALWLAARHRLPAASAIRGGPPLGLAGALALGPVMDLAEAARRIGGTCGSGATMVVGGADATPDRYTQAAPIGLLPLGIRHTILMGELDGIMPVRPREEYVRLARGLGDRVTLVVVPDAGHFEVIAPTSAAWPIVLQQIEALLPTAHPR